MADENDVSGKVSAEELQEAEAMGWADKDQWRGKPEEWVDAKTFLERGRTVMPMLKKNNERLVSKVGTLEHEVTSMRAALQGANAALEALQESHDADVKEQVEAAKKDLKAEIARASREGDHEGLAEATSKLQELNTTAAAATDEKPKKKDEGGRVEIHPEVQAWYAANPEFNANSRQGSVRKIALANAVAVELRQGGETAVGAAFLDLVAAEVDKTLGGTSRGGSSKVNGGNGGGGRKNDGGGGGKTYSDLPKEAKEICDKQAARLVGPNRAHKDVDSWRKSYARQYFSE